jgi:hypothetical protein
MTKKMLLALSLFATSALAPSAVADTMSLYNWGFNVDGTIIDKANTPPLPAAINAGSFDFNEGLGTLTIVAAGPGTHYVDIFFDNDLNPAQFAQDNSAAVGTLAAGESWEIGTGAESGGTQLYADFLANDYDDADNAAQPDDVAVGLAFSFTTTDADPDGIVTVSIGETAPSSGFYITQANDNSTPSEIYISGSEVNAPAPEPASWLLILAPACIFVWRWRKINF